MRGNAADLVGSETTAREVMEILRIARRISSTVTMQLAGWSANIRTYPRLQHCLSPHAHGALEVSVGIC